MSRVTAFFSITLLLATLIPIGGAQAADTDGPVDWHSWSPAVFERAAEEDKLVLLDLGAVWCHWCHVMDRETYANPDVAAYLAEHYVAVKVDQDRRPDLANRFRLRLVAKGRNLHLEAMDPDQAIPLTIGRATIPARDRNGFVLIRLDSGWQLRRRVYKGRTLNHVYFANPTPVNQLLAQAGTSSRSAGFARLGLPAPPQQPGSGPGGNRPIRLEVIPYRP